MVLGIVYGGYAPAELAQDMWAPQWVNNWLLLKSDIL